MTAISPGSPADRGAGVRLNRGDPYLRTPDVILEAIARACYDGHTHYGPAEGLLPLRERVAARAPAASEPSPEQVLVTNGAAGALFAAISALVTPGDEVMLLDPGYSIYRRTILIAGGVPVPVPLRAPAFELDLGRIESLVTERTRLLVISNPGNPTGSMVTRDEFGALAELAARHDFLVLSDEVYDAFAYGREHCSALSVPELEGRLIYVNSFSKTFAMTGWRVGYLICPPSILAEARVVHAQTCIGVNVPGQFGAIAGLDGAAAWVDTVVEEFGARRAELLEGLTGIASVEVLPSDGGLYLFPRVGVGQGSREIAEVLRARGLLVRDATEFGSDVDGRIRISYCVPETDVRAGIDIMKGVFDRVA